MCGAALVAGALAISGSLAHAHVVINGAPLAAAELGNARGGLALGGSALGLLVAALLLMIVLPLALRAPLPIAPLLIAALPIAALLLGGALFLAPGVAAVRLSPLLLLGGLGGLVWRLARGNGPNRTGAMNEAPAPAAAEPAATIAR